MLDEPVEDPGGTTPRDLLERYQAALARTVDAVGVDAIVESTGLDREVVEAFAAGAGADRRLSAAAAVLAAAEGTTADAVLADCREGLLLGMSSAMLTVDRVAADVGGDLDPKEVQAKIEGRHPMTLAEYARLRHHIAAAA